MVLALVLLALPVALPVASPVAVVAGVAATAGAAEASPAIEVNMERLARFVLRPSGTAVAATPTSSCDTREPAAAVTRDRVRG